MKKMKIFLLIMPLAILLMACPVGIDYPADEEGKNPIEKKLLGTWSTSNKDHEVQKMEIKQNDKNSYTIEILSKGEMYMPESTTATAWITTIDDLSIIYVKPKGETQYYHYCYKIENKNSFYVYDMSMKVGGLDAVTSTQTLRDELKASSKMEDFLSNETLFTKE